MVKARTIFAIKKSREAFHYLKLIEDDLIAVFALNDAGLFFSKSYTPNPTPKKIYSQMTNPINTLSFRFHSVSTNQIREIVMAFPSDKAPGYYKLPMSIIKDSLPCNFPIVMDIVYRRLLISVFPTDRKISEVIPLPKEGDHDVANNMQQQPPCVPAHCSVHNM